MGYVFSGRIYRRNSTRQFNTNTPQNPKTGWQNLKDTPFRPLPPFTPTQTFRLWPSDNPPKFSTKPKMFSSLEVIRSSVKEENSLKKLQTRRQRMDDGRLRRCAWMRIARNTHAVQPYTWKANARMDLADWTSCANHLDLAPISHRVSVLGQWATACCKRDSSCSRVPCSFSKYAARSQISSLPDSMTVAQLFMYISKSIEISYCGLWICFVC